VTRRIDSDEESASRDERIEAFDVDGAELRALLATVKPAAPSPQLRRRVLESVAVASRFEDLGARVAAIADLSLEAARAQLAHIDDVTAPWIDGTAPGVSLLHIRAGPARAGAIVGFVRVEAGVSFPLHTHVGDEHALILQGALVDDAGVAKRRGDELVSAAGTSHDFRSRGPEPLILLVAAHGGIEL
jgi:anti-sigma factor ChrR (cupin superfamily)